MLTINRLLALNILLFLASPASLLAQESYLNDPSIIIQRHDRRESRTIFESDGDDLDNWALVISNSDTLGRHGDVLQYEELPACAEAQVRLAEVHYNTPGTENDDILFYSSKDAAQAAHAARYKNRKAAYKAALIADSQTGVPDEDQVFARFIGVRCLPTRFRFVFIGSKRYAELRSGDDAWQE